MWNRSAKRSHPMLDRTIGPRSKKLRIRPTSSRQIDTPARIHGTTKVRWAEIQKVTCGGGNLVLYRQAGRVTARLSNSGLARRNVSLSP
jgi:hypothetical protein